MRPPEVGSMMPSAASSWWSCRPRPVDEPEKLPAADIEIQIVYRHCLPNLLSGVQFL
jgi:hypothetical protein